MSFFLCQQCQLLYIETYFCLLGFLDYILSGSKIGECLVPSYFAPWWWCGSTTFPTLKRYWAFRFLCVHFRALYIDHVFPPNLHYVACCMYLSGMCCQIIFYNISDGIWGLICPLLEPETLLMFGFFLYLPENSPKAPARMHR